MATGHTRDGPFSVIGIGFDGCLGSALLGPLDLFNFAGRAWDALHGDRPQARFSAYVATLGKLDFRCAVGSLISPQLAAEEINSVDLVVIPTIGLALDRVLTANAELYPLLRRWHAAGALIAGNDTGTFLLAEAGLLNGREATTHWGYTRLFEQRYPLVDLKPDQLITSADGIFCAGGGTAWLDLSNALIEHFHGYDVARNTARVFVFDIGRRQQTAYSGLAARHDHGDATVAKLQDWIGRHYAESITLARLAEVSHLSERTLKRRFRETAGLSPIAWLQRVRVDQAKRRLEVESDSFEVITQAVGYQDAASFRRIFKRLVGMTPSAYRSRFQRLPQ